MVAEPDSTQAADAHWVEMVDSALQAARIEADARERHLLVQTVRRCGELDLPQVGRQAHSERKVAVDFTRVLRGLIGG